MSDVNGTEPFLAFHSNPVAQLQFLFDFWRSYTLQQSRVPSLQLSLSTMEYLHNYSAEVPAWGTPR